MDAVNIDTYGFLICGIHHERRYGWAGLPVIGDNRGKFTDWDLGGYTPLEIEGYMIFGDDLPAKFVLPPPHNEDMRDMRTTVQLVKKTRSRTRPIQALDRPEIHEPPVPGKDGLFKTNLLEYQRELAMEQIRA